MLNRFGRPGVALVLAVAAASLAIAQKPKSQKEVDAVQAVFQATDNDARIKAAENLLVKFADTEFKGLALEIALDSTLRKNDSDGSIIYAERILEAFPGNLNALASLAKLVAEHIGENDLDKEDKIKRADELAKKCLSLAPDAKNPYPTVFQEAQWPKTKNDYMADAHDALAAVAMARKKPDLAVTDYKASLELRKDPATMVRIGQAYIAQRKFDEAIGILNEVIAIPDVNPVVKQFAGREKVKAVMEKSKQPKPAEAPKS